MAKDVVAEFVTDDRQGFGVASLLDGGVPDDHTLGSAEAGDIGIHPIALFAGTHEEDAIARDGNAGVLSEGLNVGDELGMFVVERLELIEQRVDDPGAKKMTPSRMGRAANQKKSHQRRGLRRMTANRISVKMRANSVPTISSLVQSQNQEPQRCTDCS